MNELDELLKQAKEKSYTLANGVEVIEIEDLESIIDKLKDEIVERYT